MKHAIPSDFLYWINQILPDHGATNARKSFHLKTFSLDSDFITFSNLIRLSNYHCTHTHIHRSHTQSMLTHSCSAMSNPHVNSHPHALIYIYIHLCMHIRLTIYLDIHSVTYLCKAPILCKTRNHIHMYTHIHTHIHTYL